MKSLLKFIAVSLLLGVSQARADSVAVTLEPALFPDAATTVSASFVWDTAAQTLSDFVVDASGNVTGFISTPTSVQFAETGALDFVSWLNPVGDIFQLNYGDHGHLVPSLVSEPGTYAADLFLGCRGTFCFGGDHFVIGRATVSAIPSQAIATPEPEPLPVLSIALIALFLVRRNR